MRGVPSWWWLFSATRVRGWSAGLFAIDVVWVEHSAGGIRAVRTRSLVRYRVSSLSPESLGLVSPFVRLLVRLSRGLLSMAVWRPARLTPPCSCCFSETRGSPAGASVEASAVQPQRAHKTGFVFSSSPAHHVPGKPASGGFLAGAVTGAEAAGGYIAAWAPVKGSQRPAPAPALYRCGPGRRRWWDGRWGRAGYLHRASWCAAPRVTHLPRVLPRVSGTQRNKGGNDEAACFGNLQCWL